MYHLHPIKNFHWAAMHSGGRFDRLVHDERFQAVAVAIALLVIITFAIWLGSIGY